MTLYQSKPVTPVVVDALQLNVKVVLHLEDGEVTGEVGDYLVTDLVSGKQFIMTPEEFHAAYEAQISYTREWSTTWPWKASDPPWKYFDTTVGSGLFKM